MKKVFIVIFLLLLIIFFGALLVSFQVRETELALVIRFGESIREIKTPGLCFKLPAPIDRVYKFDSRIRTFEADLGETSTKETIPINESGSLNA